MRRIIYLLLCWMLSGPLLAGGPGTGECEDGEQEIVVRIQTDDHGAETSWVLLDGEGRELASREANTYDDNQLYETSVCISAAACFIFTIQDRFGDGIQSDGFYQLLIDTDTVLNNVAFSNAYQFDYDCPAGSTCLNPISISAGNQNFTKIKSYFEFVPDSVGAYHISTCQLTDCDTRIAVYPWCNFGETDNQEGSLRFNDDDPDCGSQSSISIHLNAGQAYLIKVDTKDSLCVASGDSVPWQIEFRGPIRGCLDSASCNYNPLATIDDGSCIAQGSADCPERPDLVVDQPILRQSIRTDRLFVSDPCLVEEGCLLGYGYRDLIRFTTRISNIGELDYFLGNPARQPDIFSYNNCHNHYHYEGYAEYLLFNENDEEIPVGLKTGFCLMDSQCPEEDDYKYSCEQMGVTAGCYDEYTYDLDCQWVDVTDIPDGKYTLVTRVNWPNAPDAVGRQEKNINNNWAQVCLELDRSGGSLEAIILEDDCPFVVDCTGRPQGDARPDCAGNCNGPALYGDLDENQQQNQSDLEDYLSLLLSDDVPLNRCNDLNRDERISVYDAALFHSCLASGSQHTHTGGGLHDHCAFPAGVMNPADSVWAAITDLDMNNQSLELSFRHPNFHLHSFQLSLEGVVIDEVEMMVPRDPEQGVVMYAPGGKILGFALQDSLFTRSSELQAGIRVHFSAINPNELCVQLEEVVTHRMEQAVRPRSEECVQLVNVMDPALANFRVLPNPSRDQITLENSSNEYQSGSWSVFSPDGRLMEQLQITKGARLSIDCSRWPRGIYFYRIRQEAGFFTGKLIVQ